MAQILPQQSTGHSHFPTTTHIVVIVVRRDLGLGLLRHNHVRQWGASFLVGQIAMAQTSYIGQHLCQGKKSATRLGVGAPFYSATVLNISPQRKASNLAGNKTPRGRVNENDGGSGHGTLQCWPFRSY
jgi:hypothetical protein